MELRTRHVPQSSAPLSLPKRAHAEEFYMGWPALEWVSLKLSTFGPASRRKNDLLLNVRPMENSFFPAKRGA